VFKYDDVRLPKINMKVCHFVSYTADSQYLMNLGRGLANHGISLTIGTLFETGKETPEWLNSIPEADYFCFNAKSKKDFPGCIWKLSKILRREKVEILQTHLWEASLVSLLAARLARTPLRIFTRHHLDQAHLIGKKIPLEIDRWTAREAMRVVVLSNAVKEFMISADHIDGRKIQVIYQGFDFERFAAENEAGQRVREEFGFTQNDFVIGCIANFFPTKGHRFLLQSVKSLLGAIPNLKLFFVGSGGDKKDLERQIQELGLAERVVFSGFRKDVPACMNAMDLVVHPSLSEAFCQVLIESMSVGKPLISTDVGGAKEVITNGETGILVPPEDAEAIAKAIKEVYFNQEFCQKMALAGQKSVRERFTIENMVNQQIECYENWLKEVKLKIKN
jgi:glycosyltransferase involved in cell wall biosynthesis